MGSRYLHLALPSVVAVLLLACHGAAPSMLPVRSDAVVDLGAELAAARLTSGSVEVLVQDSSGIRSVASTRSSRPGQNTVHLMSLGGETGSEFNAYVYGTAVTGVSTVRLSAFAGYGGQVVDGAWVIVLREKDVTPEDLHWTFHAADGSVLASGDGIGVAEP